MQGLKIAEDLKKAINSYVNELRNIYTADLVSVILYGSAAGENFSKTHSNINLLVVLKNTNLQSIDKSRKLVNKFSNRRIEPLFFSHENVAAFCDAFPVEYLDMTENHHCLYGTDVLSGIRVDQKNLRFQCEQELKSKLILIKQQYLRINPNDRGTLIKFLFKNFTSVFHILRNVLRVKGRVPSSNKAEVLKEVSFELSVVIPSFFKICEAKDNPVNLKEHNLKVLLADFVLEFEKLVQKLDHLV